MNNNTHCHQLREHLEAYVLNALDADTSMIVRKHLASCPDCQQIVRDYESIVSDLPDVLSNLSPLELPPNAKQQLMATINQQSNHYQSTASTPPAAAPYRPQPQSRMPHNLTRYARPVFNLLFVISLAVSAFLGVALAHERNLRLSLESNTELIFEIVDSDHTQRAFLALADPSLSEQRPYGKVFKRDDMPLVVAMTGRLPQPPTGQTYNLWLFMDEQAERAGEIVVDHMGFGALVYDAQRVDPEFERAQVILQSAASTTPVGTTILSWQAQ